MAKMTINAPEAPAAVGPYVHAVKANGFVFTSGQLGLNPEDGTLPEGIVAQTEQSLKNVGGIGAKIAPPHSYTRNECYSFVPLY